MSTPTITVFFPLDLYDDPTTYVIAYRTNHPDDHRQVLEERAIYSEEWQTMNGSPSDALGFVEVTMPPSLFKLLHDDQPNGFAWLSKWLVTNPATAHHWADALGTPITDDLDMIPEGDPLEDHDDPDVAYTESEAFKACQRTAEAIALVNVWRTPYTPQDDDDDDDFDDSAIYSGDIAEDDTVCFSDKYGNMVCWSGGEHACPFVFDDGVALDATGWPILNPNYDDPDREIWLSATITNPKKVLPKPVNSKTKPITLTTGSYAERARKTYEAMAAAQQEANDPVNDQPAASNE